MAANTSPANPAESSPGHTARSSPRKPRLAMLIATACGLGNIPLAPGTWGSLVAVVIAWANICLANANWRLAPPPAGGSWAQPAPEASFITNELFWAALFAVVGVWAAHSAARYLGKKDPQNIVIDEVSGQSIAFLGLLTPGPPPHYWQYLILGFILFRVFDIWKPFPVRQAESLRGGWGIMADDWLAGIYAAVGLCIARAAGL